MILSIQRQTLRDDLTHLNLLRARIIQSSASADYVLAFRIEMTKTKVYQNRLLIRINEYI